MRPIKTLCLRFRSLFVKLINCSFPVIHKILVAIFIAFCDILIPLSLSTLVSKPHDLVYYSVFRQALSNPL